MVIRAHGSQDRHWFVLPGSWVGFRRYNCACLGLFQTRYVLCERGRCNTISWKSRLPFYQLICQVHGSVFGRGSEHSNESKGPYLRTSQFRLSALQILSTSGVVECSICYKRIIAAFVLNILITTLLAS